MPRYLIAFIVALTLLAVSYLGVVRLLGTRLGTELAGALILIELLLVLALDKLTS